MLINKAGEDGRNLGSFTHETKHSGSHRLSYSHQRPKFDQGTTA
jgi:hypothetical protein